ncbi:hypothetical protein BMF94_1167 [Rhodotorula taiwanensis]|uniref:Uncharacterized protein n=1 Tax=Rhodotorula taiwanensis TaxID=741276 RepID=A0A2S5BG66_9BASI|nr:hypothetical protein BMF94_1167 [Rhodotorula taiwanensis]
MGVFLPTDSPSLWSIPTRFFLSKRNDGDPYLNAQSAPKGPEQANPLPTLIGVVVESIVEVAILCAVGWYLAKRGIVDAKAKKTLNKINTSLFTPCLLFNKVAFSLTPDKLAELYIIPIGFVLISAFSASVAYAMGRVAGLKKGQRNFAIACATFQNSNSLPIALLQSLIGEKLPLAWGPHDTRDGMLGRGLSYLVLFSSLGIIVRWSIGVRLLSSAEAVTEDGAVPGEEGRGSSAGPGGRADVEANASGATIMPSVDGSATSAVREDDHPEREEDTLLARTATRNGDGHGNASNGKGKRASILKSSHNPTAAANRTRESPTAGSVTLITNEDHGEDDATKVADGEAYVRPATRANGGAGTGAAKNQKKSSRVFQSFPNTPIPSVYSSSSLGDRTNDDNDDDDSWNNSDDDEDENDAEWGRRRGFGRQSGWFSSPWGKKVKRGTTRAWKKVKRVAGKFGDFMTVPLWAALLSLVVACIPPLQHTLNKAEPLKSYVRLSCMLWSSSSCSVPITLVTLGAYFYSPSASSAADTSPLRREEQELPPKSWHRRLARVVKKPFVSTANAINGTTQSNDNDDTDALKRRAARGENLTVFVAVMARMVVVPLVLIPLFAYYAKVTVNIADDPIFVVVACLLIGSPTAITLAQITSSAAGQTFERLISKTLFVSYAFLTAPSTILLVLAALWIDGLQHPHKNGPGQGHEHSLVFGPGAIAAGALNATLGNGLGY